MKSPTMDADTYVDAETEFIDEGDLVEDAPEAAPKHNTTVRAGGWDDAEELLERKDSDYPTDMKVTETPQVIRFLEDRPFASYDQFWVDRAKGKRSFVSLGDDDPLSVIAGLKPRAKFSFNVLVHIPGKERDRVEVQVLTASPTLARQLKAANEDKRRGPLTKFYYAISKTGTGPQTAYTLDRIKAEDLEEEWEIDEAVFSAAAPTAKLWTADAITVMSREEHMKVAREVVSGVPAED